MGVGVGVGETGIAVDCDYEMERGRPNYFLWNGSADSGQVVWYKR